MQPTGRFHGTRRCLGVGASRGFSHLRRGCFAELKDEIRHLPQRYRRVTVDGGFLDERAGELFQAAQSRRQQPPPHLAAGREVLHAPLDVEDHGIERRQGQTALVAGGVGVGLGLAGAGLGLQLVPEGDAAGGLGGLLLAQGLGRVVQGGPFVPGGDAAGGLGRLLLTVREQAQPGDRRQHDQCTRQGTSQPAVARGHARGFLARLASDARGGLGGDAGGQGLDPLDDLRGGAEAARRVLHDAGADVVDEEAEAAVAGGVEAHAGPGRSQLVFPALAERGVEVAQEHLVEQNAQGVDVPLHHRRAARARFRRLVHAGAGPARARFQQRLGPARHRDPAAFELGTVGDRPDAEVGQDRMPPALAVLADEDVARLQVLVDDPHRVRRGGGPRDLGHQAEPLVERQRRRLPPLLGPVAEVAAGHELALEVIGRLFEPDVEQPGDVLAVAQGVAEELEQGELAFERAEPGGVEAELEDPALPQPGMVGHPDLAEAPLAELALDHPSRLARDLLAHGGPPPLHLPLFERSRPPRPRRVGGRLQRRTPFDAHLEDLEVFPVSVPEAGELVPPVRAPAQPGSRRLVLARVARGRRLGPADVLAGDVERGAGQEGLAVERQFGQVPAGRQRLADLQQARLIHAAEPHHLADVDAQAQTGHRPRIGPVAAAHGLVQVERRVHGGVGRRKVDLAVRRRFGLHRPLPADQDRLQTLVIRLHHVAGPGRVPQPGPRRAGVEELGRHHHGELGRDPLRQRPGVEPHASHLLGQVLARAERHPDVVRGRQPPDVLELEPAELVGLGGVVGMVIRAVVLGDEHEHGLVQRVGDRVLELGIRPPGLVGRPLPRLEAVAPADQADHRVAAGDPVAEHVDNGAIVGREVVLDDGQGPGRAERLGHGLTRGAQVAAGGTDKDARHRGHLGPPGRNQGRSNRPVIRNVMSVASFYSYITRVVQCPSGRCGLFNFRLTPPAHQAPRQVPCEGLRPAPA